MRLTDCLLGLGLALEIGGAFGCSGSSGNNAPGPLTSNQSGSSSCPAGSETCACYGNDTCNSGLTCASHLCVRLGAGGGIGAQAGAGNGEANISASGGAAGAVASNGMGVGVSAGAAASPNRAEGGAVWLGHGGNPASGSASVLVIAGGNKPITAPMGGVGGVSPATSSSSGGVPVTTSACAAMPQPATLLPNFLVFVYDSSSSMGDDPSSGSWHNSDSRWAPMQAGMTDFFLNWGNPGVQASITFFPAPGDQAGTCHADYATPNVPMTPLEAPQNQVLIDALQAQIPRGGTPTLPAVMGGIKYARSLVAESPGSKSAVVLLTDGEPYPSVYQDSSGATVGCAPESAIGLSNTVDDIVGVVSAAYLGSPSIRTFVVGVGDANQGNMQRIAQAGGSDLVFIDTKQDPAKTTAALVAALKTVGSKQSTCSVAVPTQNFKPELLNVAFRRADNSVLDVVRSEDCVIPGWHYDSPVNPTKVVLCPEACAEVQRDPRGTIELTVGCRTPYL